jgi:hypothetical protein
LSCSHALAQIVEQKAWALGLGFFIGQTLKSAYGLENPLAGGFLAFGIGEGEAVHPPVVHAAEGSQSQAT